MKRILLTAFAPFDQRATNQSYEIARQVNSPAVTLLKVPVTFGGAYEHLKKHLLTNRYDVLIALGEGPNRSLALEHVALNVMHARIPDNDGYQPLNTPIDARLPLALPSRLPLAEIAAVLDQKQLSYQHSYSAGTFVCNDLFFRLMASQPKMQCGFFHVPYEPEYQATTLASLQGIINAYMQGKIV